VGLYLCSFDEDEEIDGVEVGHYADFNGLRDYIVRELEGGQGGSKFPTLILHSDCDGEWSVSEEPVLIGELSQIIETMKARNPVPFVSEWQAQVARNVGLKPTNAFESFVDVDGQFVLGRILGLAKTALERRCPILFQ
jgi:hypothetical protein